MVYCDIILWQLLQWCNRSAGGAEQSNAKVVSLNLTWNIVLEKAGVKKKKSSGSIANNQSNMIIFLSPIEAENL